MSLEKIVRVFQTGDVFAARTQVAQPPLPDQSPAVLEWKGSCSSHWIDGQLPHILGFKTKDDETERTKKKERIENPDDSSQYVNIQRVVEMVLRNRKLGVELKIKPEEKDGGR